MQPQQDNNQNPPVMNQQQPAPAAPPSPQPMQTPPLQTPPGAPTPTYQATPVTLPAQSSKKPLVIIALIAGLLLLIGGAILAWFLLFSPAAQAAKASNNFMKAASTGDVDKLLELNDDPTGDSRGFLQSASDSVKGSYSLLEKTSKDGNWYFLYELTSAEAKYARTTVGKPNGKWVVTSFVYGENKLALVPTENVDETTEVEDETPAAADPAPTSASLACLSQTDYASFNYDPTMEDSVTYDTTYDPNGSTANKTGAMFFKPNTADEDSFLSTYDDWARFATENSDKQWQFRLRGTINNDGSDSTTSASDLQLAQDRANKVKSQLVSRGVPESRIVIDEPINNADEYQSGFNEEIYRRVTVTIDPTCTAAAR